MPAAHQAAEHDVDHAEPAFVVGVLLLEVDEVRRHHLQARREQARECERQARAPPRAVRASSMTATTDARSRRRRRSRDAEQQRHLADARPGSRRPRRAPRPSRSATRPRGARTARRREHRPRRAPRRPRASGSAPRREREQLLHARSLARAGCGHEPVRASPGAGDGPWVASRAWQARRRPVTRPGTRGRRAPTRCGPRTVARHRYPARA